MAPRRLRTSLATMSGSSSPSTAGASLLTTPRDLLFGRGRAGAAAGDRAAAAQAADVGDTARADAAALDAAQLVVAAGHADAADALERLLLVAIDVALAEHVGDRAARRRLGAEQLEETGRLHLLGEPRAPLGVRRAFSSASLRLLLGGELRFGRLLGLLLFGLLLLGLLLFGLLPSTTFFSSGFFSSAS